MTDMKIPRFLVCWGGGCLDYGQSSLSFHDLLFRGLHESTAYPLALLLLRDSQPVDIPCSVRQRRWSVADVAFYGGVNLGYENVIA